MTRLLSFGQGRSCSLHGITLRRVAYLLFLLTASPATAQTAYFGRVTDTIQIAGNTSFGNQATYETRICLSNSGEKATIWNEWSYGQEDKHLRASNSIVGGYTWRSHFPEDLDAPVSFSPTSFHHLAYVLDVSQARLYIDGQLLATKPITEPVGNASGSIATVGAIQRDFFSKAFLGSIDSLRISSVARYTGTSFAPPTGDFLNDAYCQLLYDFNEPFGSTSITDLSGNGHTGTLGVGFAGATAPVLGSQAPAHVVPEPASLVLVSLIGLIGCCAARLRQVLQAKSPVLLWVPAGAILKVCGPVRSDGE